MQQLQQQMQALASSSPGAVAGSKRPGGWHLCGGSDDAEPAGVQQDTPRGQKASQLQLTAAQQQAQTAQQQLAELQQQHRQCQQVWSVHLLCSMFKTSSAIFDQLCWTNKKDQCLPAH